MAKAKPEVIATTMQKAGLHETLDPLLEAMYLEFQELSRKKQDGAVNKSKILVVNRLLKDVLVILEDEASRGYLDVLDEDDMPQNSDVALILSQYRAAMKQFHERYFRYDRESREKRWWIV